MAFSRCRQFPIYAPHRDHPDCTWIDQKDADSLLGTTWLTDGMVDYGIRSQVYPYLEKKTSEGRSAHFASNHVAQLICNGMFDEAKHYFNEVNKLKENFIICIPICISNHWILAVVKKIESTKVFIYDSKETFNDKKIINQVVRFAEHYTLDTDVKYSFIKGKTKQYQDQDCGVYLILTVRSMVMGFIEDSDIVWFCRLDVNAHRSLLERTIDNAVQSSSEQCRAVQSSVEQCRAVQNSAEQCRTGQSSAEQCRAVQSSVEQCKAVQNSAELCRAVKISAEQCRSVESSAEEGRAVQIDLKNKQNSHDVTLKKNNTKNITRITNQINHSNFMPSQFTNEMFADLIRFFEENCITLPEIAKLICKVVMIDETWMDQPEFIKSFVTKYIHKNFIVSFKKKMENKKLDLCSQFQRVTELSEGGVHYSVKYLDPSPPSYIAVPSQKFGKTDEKQDLCANCNVSSNIKTLYFCNNCRVTKYCGVLCLVADYGKHNMYCEEIAQTTIKHPVDIDINIYNVSQIINKTLETHQIQTLKQDKLIQQLSDKNKNLTTKLREQTRLKSKSEETTSPSVIYRENDISGRKDIFIGKSVTMNKTYRSVYCKIKKNSDVKKNNLIKRGELKK